MLKKKDAQRFAKIAKEQVCDRRERYRRFSAECADVARATAAATHSPSCGTNDRDCIEVNFLQEALDWTSGNQRI